MTRGGAVGRSTKHPRWSCASLARSGVAGVLLLLVAGCQPLYLPPVPEPLVLPERLEVGAAPDVAAASEALSRPAITVELRNVPAEGWLALQWFAPDNREVASESVWIAPADEGRRLALSLPDDVDTRPGRWRAVLSFAGDVVRQVSIEVGGPR